MGDKDPHQIYDLDSTQREILEWKHQRRMQLRTEYLREIHNPNSTAVGHLVSTTFILLHKLR